MHQNLGVHFLCTQSFLLLSMDIDGYLDDLMDPLARILRVISLEDVLNLLGEPAKSLRVRDNLLFDLEQRKRAISTIVLDLGTKCKY